MCWKVYYIYLSYGEREEYAFLQFCFEDPCQGIKKRYQELRNPCGSKKCVYYTKFIDKSAQKIKDN